MKVIFATDIHIGNHRLGGGQARSGLNERCRMALEALHHACKVAQVEEASALVIAGDLFDTSRPNPQMIAAVQKVFLLYAFEKIILLGNHDMDSMAPGDHALGPLAPVARIVDKPQRITIKDRIRATGSVDFVELWAIPFRPGEAAEWLPSVLAEVQGIPATGGPASPTRVLALHLGLQDGKTPPWLQGAHDSIEVEKLVDLMRKHEIVAAFAGNWHDPRVWDFHETLTSTVRRVVQVGTLCPTGFDNPGLEYGTLAVFDSRKRGSGKPVLVPGPRFVTNEVDAVVAKERGFIPFVRLKADSDKPEESEAAVQRLVEHGVTRVEVLADTAEAQAALRAAAGVARSAKTVDQAVAEYVTQMPLEDPSLRPHVLERVKRYLGAG